MSVHSCYCIIFCIALFEVRFQIELKFHFEIALEKLEKEKMNFFPPFLLLACWPVSFRAVPQWPSKAPGPSLHARPRSSFPPTG